MLIEVYKKIENKQIQQFSMPLSLRIIKECSEYGITNLKHLHIADVLSLVYSIRIDRAKEYLEHKRQEKMSKRGIKEISRATDQDFNNL